MVELDSIDGSRPFDVTCGWVGEASFGVEGLAHVTFLAIFFCNGFFRLQRLFWINGYFLWQRLFLVLATFLLHRRAFLTDGYFDIIFLSCRLKRS